MGSTAILQFDLEEGRNANAVVAAKALIEWVEAMQAASRVLDPSSSISVDLISAEAACLRFSTVMNFVEQTVLGKVADALDPYPRIKKLVTLNVLILPGAVAAGLIIASATGDDESSKPVETTTVESERAVATSPEVQRRVKAFYKTVQTDPAIKRVIVRESVDSAPILSVERAEFAERSGLWEPEEDEIIERKGGGIWTVVVTHPVAIGKPLTWGFMREGLPFRAKMVDLRFLAAIKNRTLPVTIQEGVTLSVRVSYDERLNGQLWIPVPGTYKIEEVLEPDF
jgi:hypothetical protein